MKFFLLLLQIIPSIIAIVKQVELAIPGTGKGAQRLEVVLNTVHTAASAAPEVMEAIEGRNLDQAVTGMVNGVVKTLNAAGALKPQPQP